MTYLAHDILIPVDGSAASKEAARYGRDLAEKLQARVTLLHVWPGRTLYIPPYTTAIEAASKEEEKAAEDLVEHYRTDIFKDGPPVETMIREGLPQQVIAELANQGPYDLLIIGSQGKGPMRQFFVGSVARYAVAHVQIPVLVMHPVV